MNLYAEFMESGRGKNVGSLYPTPGLTQLGVMPTFPGRAAFQVNDRLFTVGGNVFYEVLSTWLTVVRGAMATNSSPAQIFSNGSAGHQVFILSGRKGYIYDLITNAFTEVITDIDQIGYSDGYFTALNATTGTFMWSLLLDGLTWPPGNVQQRNDAPDNWATMWVAKRELWLLGKQTGQVWQDVGDDEAPFAPIQGVQLEYGCAVPFTISTLGAAPVWLASNDQGQGMVLRAPGYQPQRISTHAVELAISRYSTIADAVGWTYEERGHAFYVLSFPTAKATWVFDLATGLWHERGYWDTANMEYQSIRQVWHAFAFGKHVVLDRVTGAIYEQSLTATSDPSGAPIRRMRQFPHIFNEKKRVRYDDLELDMQVATATAAVPDPQIVMQYSDDGGFTWSPERMCSIGQIGQYFTRVQWQRLGMGRDRVFRIIASDAVAYRFTNAYLNATSMAS